MLTLYATLRSQILGNGVLNYFIGRFKILVLLKT
jgi:hypothetical protein